MSYLVPFVLFFFALSTIPALAADSSLLDGAKREGSLVFYTTMDIQNSGALVEAFSKKYPFIKGDLVRLGGTAMVSRIMTEAQAGANRFDVAIGISPSFTPMRERNLIAPYLSPEIPNLHDDLYDPKGYWSTVYLNTWVLGYNSKAMARNELPKSYDDLLKPQYKQKFIIDIENHDLFVALSQEWGQEKAVNYFNALAKQIPVFLRGNTNRANFVSVGERPMTFVYAQVIERMKQSGAPVDWIPLEPVAVETNVTMLSAKAAHPNAARLFVDYLISKEGQEFLKTFRRIGPRKDVKPEPAKLFEGFRRRVVPPEAYKNFRELTQIHNEALGIR
ncbi:MAG: extracellular solute-binding protein [Deltaproteobacteria bacterium]|nr:extracellular solute-binding protein [Deltaproteobacteria bacterium]